MQLAALPDLTAFVAMTERDSDANPRGSIKELITESPKTNTGNRGRKLLQ